VKTRASSTNRQPGPMHGDVDEDAGVVVWRQNPSKSGRFARPSVASGPGSWFVTASRSRGSINAQAVIIPAVVHRKLKPWPSYKYDD